MIPLRDSIRSRSVAVVNYFLIAANVLAFFYQIQLHQANALESFVQSYGVVPVVLLSDWMNNAYTLVTSQFLHGGLMHLIGNMLYLHIFGDNVEDRFGHFNYLLFYLLSGIGAALAQVYFHPGSIIPMIGASGAIAGVLGAYFVLFPGSRVLTLIPLGFFSRIVEIPSVFFLGIWFLIQALSGTAAVVQARAVGQDVGGVAWWAHAGGFVVGFFFAAIHRIRYALR